MPERCRGQTPRTDATGREAEVLAARRAEPRALGRGAGVRDHASRRARRRRADVARAPSAPRTPTSRADTTTEELVTVAGRVVLKRDMGKLEVPDDPRSRGRPPDRVREGEPARRRLRPARRGRPRRHHRRRRAPSARRAGRAQRLRRTLGDADEGAPAAAGEVARPAGPRSPAATPLPPSDRRRGAARCVPRARRRAQDDAARARRARVRRVRRADAADGRGRRERTPVHDAPPRARHPDEAPDLARALPQADARRRRRAGLRARPQLPQRGHRPRPQPRVHDARGLPGLRRLPHDDGALRDARRECRPRREPDDGARPPTIS